MEEGIVTKLEETKNTEKNKEYSLVMSKLYNEYFPKLDEF